MVITRVVKKGKNDVVIHFNDDKFLILSLETFLKSGLRKNEELSEEHFSFLIEENKKYHIRQRAFRLLGRRQHSVAELKRKLWQKDYDNKLIDEVINNLVGNNYLNDEDFAKSFVEEKIRTKKWSEKKLSAELIKRGVIQSIISEVLKNSIPEDQNFNNALALAQKKMDSLKRKYSDVKEIKNRLSAFLYSKGFDYDVIRDICDKIIKDETGED